MLTARQKDLLDFIIAYQANAGIAPSYDEMKDGLGLNSKSGVHRLITALEERRHIRRLPNRARAIEVVETPDHLCPACFQPLPPRWDANGAGEGGCAGSKSV